jgi:Domain of unknown function (DUF4355)
MSDTANTATDNNGTDPKDVSTDPQVPNAGAITPAPKIATDASGQTFTQADLDRVVADRLARERGKYADYTDLQKKAAEFDKIQDANKSDLDKANDALSAAQVELAELRVASVRSAAATAAGLPAELHEFITATDPEKAAEQAKVLAAKLTPPNTAGGIPQGSRPGAAVAPDFNTWLRESAGR